MWHWILASASIVIIGVVPASAAEAPRSTSRALAPLVRILADSDDIAVQLDVLRGMHEALQGRRNVTAPEGWSEVYRKLASSKNAEVREKVLQLSVLFGDPQALAALRRTAADPKADATARRNALQTLIEKAAARSAAAVAQARRRSHSARPGPPWLGVLRRSGNAGPPSRTLRLVQRRRESRRHRHARLAAEVRPRPARRDGERAACRAATCPPSPSANSSPSTTRN